MADKNLALQLLITAKDQASAALTGIKDRVAGISSAVSAAIEPLRSFGGLLTAAIGLGSAREVVGLADAYTRLTNSLRVATTDQAGYQAALDAVTAIARRSNADLQSTADLYGKIAQSAQSLGLKQQQVADVTELVAKAMQLSGADAGTAAGAIQQLGQALGTGVLRGDEFNSVMEASPKLMEALAAGLGVAIGDLRAMAEAGQLTASTVTTALLSQKTAIDELYGKLPQTVGQAMTGLSNAATLFVGKLNEQTGGIQALGSGLQFLANNLDAVAAVAGGAAVAAVTKYTAAIAGQVQAAALARAAARDQAIAAAQEQQAAIAAAQGHVAAAQAAYNHALAEQRLALATQAAIEKTFGAIAGEQGLAAARARSAVAAQAVTAATERYAAAQTTLSAAQASTVAGAGLFSRALGFLTGPAGIIMLAVGAMASLYAAFKGQSTVSDELAGSTDRYAESLRNLNEAQINARAQELNKAIQEQEQVVADATASVDQYRDGHTSLWEELSTTKTHAELLTAAEGKQADATEKLNQLRRNLEATHAALGVQQQKTLDQSDQELVAATQQALTLDRLNTAIDQRRGFLEKGAKAQEAITQAQIAQAEAEGRVYDAAQLNAALAEQRLTSARTAAELAQGEATAAQLKATALERVASAHQHNNPQEVEAARLAREAATLKQREADAAQALVSQLEAERDSVKTLTAQKLAQHAAQLQAVDDASRVLLASKAEAEQALALARAKGQEEEARQQLVAIATIEARIAQLAAERKRIEAQAAAQVVQAIQQEIQSRQAQGEIISETDRLRLRSATTAMQTAAIEAQAAGLVAEAEARKAAAAQLGAQAGQQKTDSNQQVADSEQRVAGFVEQASLQLNKNAEASEEASSSAGDFARIIANQINYWRDATGALSEATQALFEFGAGLSKIDPQFGRQTFGSISDGADQAASKISELTGYIRRMEEAMLYSTGNIGWMLANINRAGAAAQKAFYEQKLEAEKLEAQLAQVGETGVGSFNNLSAALRFVERAGQQTRDALWLLGEEDLSQLQAALDTANEKLQAMQQATEDARQRLAELDAELASAKGDDQRAALLRQQLDYQQQLAEIERQRAAAEQAGNRDLVAILDQQIAKLNEIHRLKTASLQADAQAARAGTAATNSRSTSSAASPSASSASGGAKAGAANTFYINVDGKDLLSEEAVRNKIVPILDRVTRLRG